MNTNLFLFLLNDVTRYVVVADGRGVIASGENTGLITDNFEVDQTYDLTINDVRLPTPAELGFRDEVTPYYRKALGLPMMRIHELIARKRLEIPDYTVPCLTAVIDRFANTPAVENFYQTIAWLTGPEDIMVLYPDGMPEEFSFTFSLYNRHAYEEAKIFNRAGRERPYMHGGIIYRGPFRRTDPFSVHLGALDPNEHQWTTHT